MSSVKVGENPTRRKSKVSSAMFVNGGLVGPKPRSKGIGDGQPVNIPALLYLRYHDGVTRFDRSGICMVGCVSRKPSSGRQIRWEVKVSGNADPSLAESWRR